MSETRRVGPGVSPWLDGLKAPGSQSSHSNTLGNLRRLLSWFATRKLHCEPASYKENGNSPGMF